MLTENLPQKKNPRTEESENEITLIWDWTYGKLEKQPNRYFSKKESVRNFKLNSNKKQKLLSNSKEDDIISLSTNQTLNMTNSSHNRKEEMEWIRLEIQSYFQRQFYLRNEVFKAMRELKAHQEYIKERNCCMKIFSFRTIKEQRENLTKKFLKIREELESRVDQFTTRVNAKEPNFIKRTSMITGVRLGCSDSFDRILPRSLIEEKTTQDEFYSIFQNYSVQTEFCNTQNQSKNSKIIFDFLITITPKKTASEGKNFLVLSHLEEECYDIDEESSYLLQTQPNNNDFTFNGAYKISREIFFSQKNSSSKKDTFVSFSDLET